MRVRVAVRCVVVFAALTLLLAGPSSATIRLVGSGASFPAPLYTTWFQTFSRANPGIQVTYQSKGSGAGIRDFQARIVDFAASDAAMDEEEQAVVEGGVQLLPMTAGEIVLAYNLEGAPDLKLPRAVYPGIFLGTVKMWNDPAIAAANPGVELPDIPITVVVRADSSGTTYVFSKHLSTISPDFDQAVGIGKSLNWPNAAKMVKSPKNDGVAATIRQTPGAVGYIEFGFGRMANLAMAHLENKAGKFIAPGGEGGPAALANATIPEDMIVWLPDPEGDASYPIVTYTWMLFYKENRAPERAEALRKMVEYCLTEGQKISEKAGYIPLPENVVEKVRAASANIQ